MNTKTKSWVIAISFGIYVSFLYVYHSKIVNMMANSGFFMGAILYLFANPAYLLLIYYIIKTHHRKVRAIFASILVILSLDMVASPRLMVNEIFATGSSTVTNMGAIAIKAMANFGFNVKLAYFLYYWVLPIIFFVISMELLGHVDFIRKIKSGGI